MHTLRHVGTGAGQWLRGPEPEPPPPAVALPEAAETFLAGLRTGDLVFFRGRALVSRVIEAVCRSPWSHVAMAIELPGSRQLALWEAVRASEGLEALRVPGSRVPRPEPGERDVRAGVRLVDARAKLAHAHYGALGVRRLAQLPRGVPDRAALARQLLPVVAALDGHPYPPHLSTLLWSWVDLCDACGATWNANADPLAAARAPLFCSQLVVATLVAAGLAHAPHAPGTPVPAADRQRVAAEYTVADLCVPARFDVPLLAGTGAAYRAPETTPLPP